MRLAKFYMHRKRPDKIWLANGSQAKWSRFWCPCCRDVTAVILDRPRHADIIRECREAGVRIRLISDGDVGAAIEVAKDGAPVDILLGIGGTPEGAALHELLGSGRFCCRSCSRYLPARPQVVRGVQEVRQSTKHTKTLQSLFNLSFVMPCSSPASMHPVPANQRSHCMQCQNY